jgi:hypothetical protein
MPNKRCDLSHHAKTVLVGDAPVPEIERQRPNLVANISWLHLPEWGRRRYHDSQ